MSRTANQSTVPLVGLKAPEHSCRTQQGLRTSGDGVWLQSGELHDAKLATLQHSLFSPALLPSKQSQNASSREYKDSQDCSFCLSQPSQAGFGF